LNGGTGFHREERETETALYPHIIIKRSVENIRRERKKRNRTGRIVGRPMSGKKKKRVLDEREGRRDLGKVAGTDVQTSEKTDGEDIGLEEKRMANEERGTPNSRKSGLKEAKGVRPVRQGKKSSGASIREGYPSAVLGGAGSVAAVERKKDKGNLPL